MVHVCLTAAEILADDPPATTVLLIGTKLGFEKYFDWACLEVLAPLQQSSSSQSGPPQAKKQKIEASSFEKTEKLLLASILSGLQPSLDAVTSAECYLARPNHPKPLKVVLGVLPDVVSRHNSPGQPYAITALVKKHLRRSEHTAILPLCTSSDHKLSVACAIARVGGPILYNRKTSGTGSTDTTAVLEAKVLFPTITSMPRQTQFAKLSTGIQLARNLVDQPCNELHTKAFTEIALEKIQGLEYVTSRVITGEDLREQGYGGLYNVGKAAAHPPALVILSYEPPSAKNQKSTVFVGKGIVFDTGGTQIKTKAGMPGMKRDM